jgi:hypothetical protein
LGNPDGTRIEFVIVAEPELAGRNGIADVSSRAADAASRLPANANGSDIVRRAANRVAVIAMLEHWAQDAERMSDEEIALNTKVLRAIDEDRLSDRPLFGQILKPAAE